MNPYLTEFIQQMDSTVEQIDEPHDVATRTETYLANLIEHPEFLDARHRVPAADRYQQHLVHVHPEGKYSIVALVWRPGQETPVHDHRCWCVVGVLQGRETETRYRLYEDAGALILAVTHETTYQPGEVCALVPPDEDIHRVANGGTNGLTISMHIYGADVAKLGTSINHVFDQPVVHSPPAAAAPVSWRNRD